ncbi:hypothetical protein M9H77_06299 [Catharanthus roseus]|uniref:Uncharacterized protein n=1 Tax=Catharanthus roseus TaxID=4058 RepID=A0ACC0BRR6_CATRO|nr:hypothetical protein M9H77_06299 [Catharanthus roseus]
MVLENHTSVHQNPANRDTRSTSMLQEVDDMASVVIQEQPSSLSQMAVFVKKVQMIIRRCIISIGGTLGCTPLQHDIQRTFPSLQGGSGTLQMPLPPNLGFAPFHSPHPTSFGFSGFRAPPPPGIADSSTLHQPIWQASSSDEEERTNDKDVVRHLGFGHRVGKKTTRFTPSD